MKSLAEILAILLHPIARLHLIVAKLPTRFWRLISLRAQAVGHIPATTQFDGPVHAINRPKITMGDQCRIGRNVQFETSGHGEIKIGSRVRINTGCVLVSNASILVGDDSLIGEYVSIRDADHGIVSGQLIRTQAQVTSAISIGCGVWIGRGSCILRGVRIGDGAVIGANSVVTHDVDENSVYAGTPARRIRVR
jgi:acetyltransferase-like isoleucine patch superfamily enzyme